MKTKFFKNLFSNFFHNKSDGYFITMMSYKNEPKQIKLNQKKIEDIAVQHQVSTETIIELLIDYDHVSADEQGECWTHHKIDLVLKDLTIQLFDESQKK
jgi:hypothetical protein